jgi:hypothetical protein
MTTELLETLTQPAYAAWIEAHLGEDPSALALRYPKTEIPAPVFSQLKYLQKAARKLPSWYAARCILPPRAYEQASSEWAASVRPGSGAACLDLSAGLGVDCWQFSKRFERVIALEADPALAAITRHNLSRLGAANVELRAGAAADFLHRWQGPPFSLIYADPDRRTEAGERRYALEDCSPSLPELLPLMRRWGQEILLKLSPLYDLAEARRQFSDLRQAIAVSAGGEMKELLLRLGPGEDPVLLSATMLRRGESLHLDLAPDAPRCPLGDPQPGWRYLYEADAAFYKLRAAPEAFAHYAAGIEGAMPHPESCFFAAAPLPPGFPGLGFEIEAALPWKPKALKDWLRKAGIKRLHYLRRHFPYTAEEARRALGLPEGGSHFLVLTAGPGGEPWAYACRRLN